MFSAFGNIIGRPLSWFAGGGGDNTSRADAMTGSGEHNSDAVGLSTSTTAVEPYEPSILDVLVVKAMLCKAWTLPVELVDTILDLAEYWPHTTSEWEGRPLPIYGGHADRENVFLVRNATMHQKCLAGVLI